MLQQNTNALKPAVMPAQGNALIGTDTTPGGLTGNIGQPRYQPAAPLVNPDMRGGSSGSGSSWGAINRGRPYNAGPQVPSDLGNFDQFRDSAYNQAMRQMQPQLEQRQRDLQQSLLNRGLQVGTEAYNNELDRLSRAENDMLGQAAYGAQQQGLAAQNQFWNQGYQYDALANALNQSQIAANASMANARTSANASMANARTGANASMYNAGLAHELGINQLNEQGRQFDINDIFRNQQLDLQGAMGFGDLDLRQQQQDLNAYNAQNSANNNYMSLIQAMLGNAPGANYQGGDLVGATQNAANAQAQAQAQSNQGIGSLIGAGLSFFSDERLKENIVFVDNVDGVNVYEFDYKDKSLGEGRYRGVMAQEVKETHPSAVVTMGNGLMAVDYSQLPVDMVQI